MSCYAVIFTTSRTNDLRGYAEMNAQLEELVRKQPGFLGIESVYQQDINKGISISYWKDLAAIQNWKNHPLHKKAQQLGRERWYTHYSAQIVKMERQYNFPSTSASD